MFDFQKITGPLSMGPLSLYVGVEGVSNYITSLVGLTLGWVSGDVVGGADINCTNQNNDHVSQRGKNL